MEPEKKSSHGALIGSIIIVLILIVGGIYLWQQKDNTETLNQIQEDQNTNTELNSLEQEINSVDTNLDVNLDTVE